MALWIEDDGAEYQLAFRYYPGSGIKGVHPRNVEAVLTRDGDCVARASSFAHKGEPFVRAYGRNIAVARLINLIQDEELKFKVAERYLNRRGEPLLSNEAVDSYLDYIVAEPGLAVESVTLDGVTYSFYSNV